MKHGKGKKVMIFKYNPKKGNAGDRATSALPQGDHRQDRGLI